MEENTQLIVLFCRAKEMNGINLLGNTLAELAPEKFTVEKSIRSLLKFIRKNRSGIKAIYALSDPDFILAIFAARYTRLQCPILLGIYHPQQWLTTLDYNYSSVRANVFSELLRNTPGSNMISSSRTTIENSKKIFPEIKGEINLIAGPCIVNLPENADLSKQRDFSKPFSIVTIGRLVDFKLESILAMIDTVDMLNEEGSQIRYDIYGEGPSRNKLIDYIRSKKYADKITVKEAFDFRFFYDVIKPYDMFFGMGSAVIQAAIAGIPSLIAIQGQRNPYTYGLFNEFDHEVNPMFGDPSDEVPVKSLSEYIKKVMALDNDAYNKLIQQNIAAADAYSPGSTIKKITQCVNKAEILTKASVSLWDIFMIRLQTYYSRLVGKPVIHT